MAVIVIVGLMLIVVLVSLTDPQQQGICSSKELKRQRSILQQARLSAFLQPYTPFLVPHKADNKNIRPLSGILMQVSK